MRHILLAAAAAAASLFAGVTHAQPTISKRLATMEPSAIAGAAKVVDDPLEHHAVISTRPAHKMKSIDDSTWGGHYLRAVVDKRTGATRFEVVQSLRYWGPRRDYQTVHYLGRDGLKRGEVTVMREDENACSGNMAAHYVDCIMSKDVAFQLDDAQIRAIADGKGGGWTYKLKERGEKDVVASIAPVEAQGLLLALQELPIRR